MDVFTLLLAEIKTYGKMDQISMTVLVWPSGKHNQHIVYSTVLHACIWECNSRFQTRLSQAKNCATQTGVRQRQSLMPASMWV